MKKKYMDEEEDEDEDDDDVVPRKTPSDASFAPPVRRMCVFAPSVREAHVCVCPHARPHIYANTIARTGRRWRTGTRTLTNASLNFSASLPSV